MKRERGVPAPKHKQPCLSKISNTNNGKTPGMVETGDVTAAPIANTLAIEALQLLAASGFVRVNELQRVSTLNCSACREANVSWTLTVSRRTPTRLLDMMRPKPEGVTMGAREACTGGTAAAPQRSVVPLPLTIRHLR